MASPNRLEGVRKIRVIGKGAFGSVFLVENDAKEQFAVKVMSLEASLMRKEVAENEVKVLKNLKHQHVLLYVGSFSQRGLLYVITEYCCGGDLSGFLTCTKQPVPEDLLLVWLWQMACGLEYMHTHDPTPVLHRDLKPSNVYLTDSGKICLGDMGIARILDNADAMARTFCGTLPYMSPEALREEPYNSKTDIWSLGCCVVEMATLERAYNGANIYILRNAVHKTRKRLPKTYSNTLDKVVSKMLLLDYRDRLTATAILDDPSMVEYEHVSPIDILRKHKLTRALGSTGGSPASSSVATSTATTTSTSFTTSSTASTSDADSTDSLTDGMSSLTTILDKDGEPVSAYRNKMVRRMPGRRSGSDGSTMSSSRSSSMSDSMQTVMCSTQTVVSKTKMNKAPFVPAGVKVPRVPSSSAADTEATTSSTSQQSLTRDALSSCMSVLTTSMQSFKGGSQARLEQEQGTSAAASSNASNVFLIHTMKNILIQMMGSDAFQEASRLTASNSTREDVERGMSSLLGEEDHRLLTIVLVYIQLKEEVSKSSSQSSK